MSFGGIDEEVEENMNETAYGENVTPMRATKKKRKPFHYWKVGEKDYQLKLTTKMIEKLETKYRVNILNLTTDNGIPPLSTMLTIVQAAMAPWEHGVSYQDIQTLYDIWSDEGGNQISFYSGVVMPTLAVSGFFTEKQAESMMESLKDMDDLL
ncbi:DUF6096 family protein [Hespellia stercorisuis]|uniref:Uncharacterized protein n=1 Tax=Hespellia stercorisuis DSM 15480 TaxID=1121950 RepID=A0A1M6RM78_9FIRM|nr:DUF6096 family protein [Hespellia stercorisuis]SHK33555.1 hypothetical protein SAMN02745243_02732 [Hespellia stercorisuis DSM 15480]